MKKILLIDDDSAIRHVLVRILADENFGAFAAADGEEALACAARTRFDLILLNLKLPEKEGWASFQELSGLYPQVPIILMTAESNQLFPALAAGARALLEKPFDFDRLLSTIRLMLEETPEVRVMKQIARQSASYYLPGKYAAP
jgi:DNA-binding response OmpR family regulator